jgi:hypothetical protein
MIGNVISTVTGSIDGYNNTLMMSSCSQNSAGFINEAFILSRNGDPISYDDLIWYKELAEYNGVDPPCASEVDFSNCQYLKSSLKEAASPNSRGKPSMNRLLLNRTSTVESAGCQ